MTRPSRALAPVLALLLAGCGGAEETPPVSQGPALSVERETIDVETVRVAPDVLATTISAAGSIRARRESAIAAEVPGRLSAVLVDVGDEVAEGDELFRVDPVPYEVALSEARAGLAVARAELQNARAEEARVDRLVAEDVVSERRRDERKTAAAMATARVAQMEARLERAQTDLDRTVARAPYAGSVVERLAHEGAMAGSDPVIVLQESGALEVVLDIPEATLAAVRPGDPVRIHAPGLAEALESRVARVSDRVDPDTRTVEVRAPLEDSNAVLKAGSFVRAEVVASPERPRPVIPLAALLLRDGRSYVFVVKNDTAHQVEVQTGARTDESVELVAGVANGAEVVHGEVLARLVDGDRIRRLDAPVAAARREAAP